MICKAPATTARAGYIRQVLSAFESAAHVAAWREMPWATLALNATFYLDAYLTRAAYQQALTEAIEQAEREQQHWRTWKAAQLFDAPNVAAWYSPDAPPQRRYYQLFVQASASADLRCLLLAQHAVEMAEIVPEMLFAAMRWGSIAPEAPTLPPTTPADPSIDSVQTLIEQLSRGLLARRIAVELFIDRLLTLHAVQRAGELTDNQFCLPRNTAALIADAPRYVERSPNLLRAVQPHELAQRVVARYAPRAVLAIEAGLVEAETLPNRQRLLLLAALDRVLVHFEQPLPQRAMKGHKQE